ncbi:hypothetical protein XO10_06795 [Marinitoga sp. 1135]|uniref:hypothetical protein n=1 Tax=Marinitoga TaxID=160798 RepID=UPI000306E0B5|nr:MULTISPECIES: hypothetical protein [Marinitoga]APT76219.1 hypothetical protein LN42_07355 [Marinitoga sp. 1137]NUU95978.1 hypothetical protein [Marinitoga sp. 1135]NUU97890.1 hypothetical protein [Marinitoga sp. 1138]
MRKYLNIFSYVILSISIIFMGFSIYYYNNKIYEIKLNYIDNREKMFQEYKKRIELARKTNEEFFNFLKFLEKLETEVRILSLKYSANTTLEATIAVSIKDSVEIVAPFEIEEKGDIDLVYKQYKILELRK